MEYELLSSSSLGVCNRVNKHSEWNLYLALAPLIELSNLTYDSVALRPISTE